MVEQPRAGPEEPPQTRVHVAGNSALDVLVRTPAGLPEEAADTWGANTLLLDDPIEVTLGGCGAAPAWVLGRLGNSVSLNSNIGADAPGSLAASWLAGAGVRLVTADPPPKATAVHVVQLDAAGRRRSAYYPGEKVEWRRSAGEAPDWLLASGYGGVESGDVGRLRELFSGARARGARVVFDPSPWFAGRVSAGQMLGLWQLIDGLVATEEELGHWLPAGPPEALAAAALESGPQWAVVKRGSLGALFASRAGESGTVAAEPVEGRNSVGAGDTLNGRLLHGLSRGESLADAVAAAVELATNTVRNGRGVLGAFEGIMEATGTGQKCPGTATGGGRVFGRRDSDGTLDGAKLP